MDKDKLRQYLENIKALEDAMRFVFQSKEDQSVWRFSSYKQFMRKYNEIAIKVSKEIPYDGLYDPATPLPHDCIVW
ncbi:hypothetical protein DSECCO2_190500 [anaerobic digester metagenome]